MVRASDRTRSTSAAKVISTRTAPVITAARYLVSGRDDKDPGHVIVLVMNEHAQPSADTPRRVAAAAGHSARECERRACLAPRDRDQIRRRGSVRLFGEHEPFTGARTLRLRAGLR